MKLRKLMVKNFRGIHFLDWNLAGDMICLVGPGDSTKSTILLALEYLFWPNWALPISDVDFYQMKVDEAIEVSAIVTELPGTLISEDKYGLFLGFWNIDEKEHEQQNNEQDQKALQISLTIKKDLEPEWNIVSLQKDGREPQKISANDRRILGVVKIGNYIESDLAWGRNSVLTRITQKGNVEQIPSLLVDAERQIVEVLKNLDFDSLSEVIDVIGTNARLLGMDSQSSFNASMDPARVSLRQGAIALFDGDLPLSLRGEGSRRLMVMAAHKAAVKEGAIILIDEIENSLEPYRLRHLIRQLRPKNIDNHQLIFSTHSPIVVEETTAEEIYVVHSLDHGIIKINNVDKKFQKIVRSIPEAFLSKKIVICEGKTEAGFLISLDQEYWQKKNEESSSEHKYLCLAEAGVIPIESPKSGGSEAPQYAVALAKLGYQVVYFGDSDTSLNPSESELEKEGIKVVLWQKEKKGLSIEERLCLDLPIAGLKELIELAIELENQEGVSDAKGGVWNRIIKSIRTKVVEPIEKPAVDEIINVVGEMIFRESLGEAAKGKNGSTTEKGWFKRKDKGMELGKLISRYLHEMKETPTMISLGTLEKWCYE